MNKDKSKVVERLRAKITPENRIFIKKNLAISQQIDAILKDKGMTQKQLAQRLGKNESEISKLLSGFHNFTLKSIANLEAELESDIIITPLEVSEKFKSSESVSFKVFAPIYKQQELSTGNFLEEEATEYKTAFKVYAI